jgi:5'-nucleotidase
MKIESSNRKSIGVDMDGVIADTESHYIAWYKQETGETLSRSLFLGRSEYETLPDKTAVSRYIHTAGFFRTLPVMPGSVEAVRTLMEHYEVYIVSAAMEFPLSLFEKREWLAEHFPFISWQRIIFCGDKSIINTNFLIDDHPKNLDHFPGVPIMFTASHNINHHQHKRLNNWKEILEYFT